MTDLAATTTPRPAGPFDQLTRALDSIPMRGAHYRIFALVAAGSLFNAMEQYVVGFAGPALIDDWGLGAAQVGLLSTATFVAMAIGSLVSGKLGDRFGRKRVFMVNVALFSFGALLAAFAPGYAVLLAARVLIGLGLGGEISLGFTVVAEVMPTRRRGAMAAALSFVAGGIGIFAASGFAALVFGPLSGLFGGQDTAWRWLFGLLFLPAVLLLFYRRYIPETPRYLVQRGEIDETNRILSRLAADRLRADADVPQHRWIDAPEGQVAHEGAGGARFADLFGRDVLRRTLVSISTTLAVFGTAVTVAVFLPTVLVIRGYDISTSLAFATFVNLGGLIGGAVGIAAAHLLDRRTVYVLSGTSAVLFSIGFMTLQSTAAALAFGGLLAFTIQVVCATHWAYLPELFPTRLRATGSGLAATVGLLAGAVGPLVAGALLDSSGEGAMYTLIAAMCAVFAVASLFGPQTRGRALEEF